MGAFLWVEVFIVLLLMIAVIHQIVWPLLSGRPTFPFFRPGQKIENEISEVQEQKRERALDQKLQKEKSKLKPTEEG